MIDPNLFAGNANQHLPETNIDIPAPGIHNTGSGKYAVIRIKYLPGAKKIKMTDIGDWVDMYVYEDTLCKKGEYTLVNLGCAMELPDGYEGHLAPRSSTFKNFGIIQANSIGIFDNSFKGNDDIWHMPVIALKEDVMLHKGERICQFRIVKNQPYLVFQETEDLGNENRGGWGSTGK